MIPYRAEDFSVTVSVADYIARFRDAERFEGCCRACPNYGCSWGCPPFDFDVEEYLNRYSRALLIATKIAPEQRDLPIAEAKRLIHPRTAAARETSARDGAAIRRTFVRLRRQLPLLSRGYLYTPRREPVPPSRTGASVARSLRLRHRSHDFRVVRNRTQVGSRRKNARVPTLVCGFFHDGDGVVW